jgi:hypothetical protein
MTLSSRDVRALSASPGPGGVPLRPAEVDRITAVLNRSSTPRSARDSRDSAPPEDGLPHP